MVELNDIKGPYRTCATADDLVEGQCLRNAIRAAGRGVDGIIRATLLCVDGRARRVDVGRAAVAEREDHGDGIQPREGWSSRLDALVTRADDCSPVG